MSQPPEYAKLYSSAAKRPLYAKSHYRETPLVGMSAAIFEIPASKSVRINAGGQTPAWQSDNYLGDHHYSVRIIRTDVLQST